MKRYEINHYSTFGTLKASIVERFNRTFKELMWREFSFNEYTNILGFKYTKS